MCMHVSVCAHVHVYSQLGRKLCLCIMQINEILVISPFVKCITNNTRKEAIEKRCSPWLFSWHDHGWMSASVRRRLENIKGGEKSIQVKSNTSLQRESTNCKTITQPNYYETHLLWLIPLCYNSSNHDTEATTGHLQTNHHSPCR